MVMRPQRRRNYDPLWVALLLIVPAIFLWSNLKDRSNLNVFDRMVLRVSSPLQSGVSWVIGGIGDTMNGYVWLVDVEEENNELRSETEKLRLALGEATRIARQAKQLERLVDLRERTGAETVGARVVSASMGSSFRVSRITLEKPRDVKVGMAVISPDGLVGRIQRVYGDYADVLLVVDPKSSVDVVVPRIGSRGVLKGLAGKDEFVAKIDYVVRTDHVEEQDVVVTSGLGGVFPAGIKVGTVAQVVRPEYGLYQDVRLEPSVDFQNLHHVLVVLAPPPPPDPGESDPQQRRSPKTAFGVTPAK